MLTGRTGWRMGWRKKLIMQVEYWAIPFSMDPFRKVSPVREWRDATIMDLQVVERGDVEPEQPPAESRSTIPPCPQWWKDAAAKRRREELEKKAQE